MDTDTRPIGGIAFAGVLLVALAGCAWARPVTYPIAPGISASFPPSQLSASTQYAQTFCSVLAEPAFAGDSWATCDRYVRMPAPSSPSALGAIPTDWTLLLVGGLGAECFAPEVTVFADAASHLANQHGINSHRIPVAAFGTSANNAQAIRNHVATLTEPKFIAVVHSKGAADVMEAIASFPTQMSRVEAVITVAGAVGGSWLADDLAPLNALIGRALSRSCVPAATLTVNGIDSMRRETRQEFLAQTEPVWRAYSISAVSGENNTSRALEPLWKRLLPYALEQDSHIVEREAMVPGGVYLGRALGDHLAVAFPFSSTPGVPQRIRNMFDHNRFPRPALIEAAVRVVIDDLQANP